MVREVCRHRIRQNLPPQPGLGPSSMPSRILKRSKPRGQLWVILKAFISESPFPGEGGFSEDPELGQSFKGRWMEVAHGSARPALGQTTSVSETKHRFSHYETPPSALPGKSHLWAVSGPGPHLSEGSSGVFCPLSWGQTQASSQDTQHPCPPSFFRSALDTRLRSVY